jgi:hypothetical protein
MKEKRWNALPKIKNEMVKIWLDDLLESKNKMFVEELTAEEIKAEIEENNDSMKNFEVWGDRHAIVDCEDYIEVLEELLKKLGEEVEVKAKKYVVEITDTDVYINGELYKCTTPMDKESTNDDLNKRAILALADRMGYEPFFLFEEMAGRLDEILDELG